MPSKGARKPATFGRSLLCCWLASSLWPTSWADARGAAFPGGYDGAIKHAVARWWPDLPAWKLLKAQYWQESRLDPAARSPAGAEGIAQFMEPTWRDAIRALGWPRTLSRRDAAYAIEGSAWYMARLRRTWTRRERHVLERHDLGLASYNAGTANVLTAQRLCADGRLWRDIAPCMPRVTGPVHARETVDYVVKVHRWYKELGQ